MGLPAYSDDRRGHRNRVLKGATILVDVNTSEIKCMVRNMHADGAELRLPSGVQVPAEFLLYVPVDGVAYRSVVRWHDQGRVGIEFMGV